MDKSPSEAQATNEVHIFTETLALNNQVQLVKTQVLARTQPPSKAQPSSETPEPHDSLDPSDPRTLLGEPMNRVQADLLAEDPLKWYLEYWLSLGIVGVLRGEDKILMAFMIDIEQSRIPEQNILTQLRHEWDPFRNANEEQFLQHYLRTSMESEEVKRYLRDIDRMMVDKVQKMRTYLSGMEMLMSATLRPGELDAELSFFYNVDRIRPRLEEEKTADAVQRRQLPDGINGEHDQEEQDPEDIYAEYVSELSEEDIFRVYW